ncbi:MAG: hypothetical protein R2850_05235 [Bacteroidia bacterium]
MKKPILISFLLIAGFVNAQVPETKSNFQKSYLASVSEVILSAGNLGKTSIYPDGVILFAPVPQETSQPIPRFSAFLHFGEQIHLNFVNAIGMYTGFGFRNIGMINRLNDSIKVKQRVYSFGIPLALKLGDMGKKRYAAFGAEVEFFFNYKQKTFLGSGRGDKVEKFNEWVSNRTNLLQPSVFAEFCFGKGSYLRFRYYLTDFLNPSNQTFKVDGVTYNWNPEQSQLFSLSYGKVLSKKRK